jgi:pimeloyl-ACP methyl ester carboxylesterase
VRVALVHGTMDRASSFAKVVRLLAADGIDAVAFDRKGYASRAQLLPAITVDEAVDDLFAQLGVGDGDEPWAVVGHSFGGHVASLAAIRRPDAVAAVGLFETPYPWADFWPRDTSGGRAVAAAAEGPEAAAETFLRTMVGDDVWERLPPSTKAARREEGRALVADLLAIQQAPYDLADVPVPVVVGRGEHAAPHQRAGTDHAAATIPGAELLAVDGAAHGCHRSHPAGFAAFVRRVVERGQARLA